MKSRLHILFALLIAASAAALPARAAEVLLDRIAAVVNNDIILQSELERRMAVIRVQLEQRNTRLPDEKEFRRQVLDKLIDDRLQLQQAAQYGFRISDDELNRTLERIAASNGLTLEQFRDRLEQGGQPYREVREQIREEMLISQTRERLVNRRITVTDQEVELFLKSERGQKSASPEVRLSHIMIPIAEPNTAANIDAALATIRGIRKELLAGADFAAMAVRYSKGQTALEGGALGWRNLAELPDRIADAVAGLKPGQISQPFRLGSGFHLLRLEEKRGGKEQLIEQTRVRHILIKPSEIRSDAEAEQLATSLWRRIRAGEDFAELARQYSDDPGSRNEGGDLGWTNPGQMVPEFERVMQATPVGALSEPFRTPFGWHILRVEERRKKDFGEQILANRARETIRKRKFAEELDNWLRELRGQAYIEIKQG